MAISPYYTVSRVPNRDYACILLLVVSQNQKHVGPSWPAGHFLEITDLVEYVVATVASTSLADEGIVSSAPSKTISTTKVFAWCKDKAAGMIRIQ